MGRKNTLYEAHQHIENTRAALSRILETISQTMDGETFIDIAHKFPRAMQVWTFFNILENVTILFDFVCPDVEAELPDTKNSLELLMYADDELRKAIECLEHCSWRKYGKGYAECLEAISGELTCACSDWQNYKYYNARGDEI